LCFFFETKKKKKKKVSASFEQRLTAFSEAGKSAHEMDCVVDDVYITRSSRDVATRRSLGEVPQGPPNVAGPLTPQAVVYSLGIDQPYSEFNKRRSTMMFMNRVAASLGL
jgi:hypothetical protein